MEVVTMLSSLDREGARILGTIILVIVVFIEFILAFDKTPGNTLREWLLKITQLEFGAFVPFILGVLLGHFYHPPDTEVLLKLKGFWGLGIVVVVGILISIISKFKLFSLTMSRYIFFIASFGIFIGAVIWPV